MSVTNSLLLCLILVFVSTEARAGEFTFSKYCQSPEPNCAIDYSGDIEVGDVGKLAQILVRAESRSNFNHQLNLDSDGGDVAVALKLGRLIRQHRLITFTFSECYSACVIVLAGGVKRSPVVEFVGVPVGKVGIHRPYTENLASNFEKHQADFRELGRQIRNFLREGGVSDRLWDDMIQIPPEEMKLLTTDELRAYGLLGDDPAYADFEDAEKAKHLGISKQEYLKRKHQMMILCDDNRNVVMADHTGEALHSCRNEVLEGRLP